MRKRFIYEYDFGDSWQHEIKIEKVIAPEEKSPKHPVLLAGKRACPPEDIRRPRGYEHFLTEISDPESEEHEELLEWYRYAFNRIFLKWKKSIKSLKKM